LCRYAAGPLSGRRWLRSDPSAVLGFSVQEVLPVGPLAEGEAGLRSELLLVRDHLRQALERAKNIRNSMIESLVREALEEVETALEQMPNVDSG